MDFGLDKEQKDIVAAAKEFALGEFPDRAQEFDRNETFDQDIWRRACELGFVGVFIPEEYEGAGYGFFEHCEPSKQRLNLRMSAGVSGILLGLWGWFLTHALILLDSVLD